MKPHNALKKRGQETVIADSIAIAGTVLMIIIFIILLSTFKDRPEEKIGSAQLDLNADASLLNFLKIPVPTSQVAVFGGGGGAASFQADLTIADLIILGQFDDTQLIMVQQQAEQTFNQRYIEFWSLDITYPNDEVSYGHNYYWPKVKTWAASLPANLFKGTTEPYVPPIDEKSSTEAYLPGLDGQPIKVTLHTWVLYS